MVGEIFGRLEVVEARGSNKHQKRVWLCRCECGETTEATTSLLRSGKKRSCGCLKSDMLRERWEAYREPAFWNKVEKDADDGCWQWTACTGTGGYGLVGWKGDLWVAHRLAYHLEVGPIPDGMFVLHHCDNPACVNPAHLWLGTHADNMRDMSTKGRHRWAPPGRGCGATPAFSSDEVREIRRWYEAGGVSQQALANVCGVSLSTINRIINRRTYIED